jgi:hypothetical protein
MFFIKNKKKWFHVCYYTPVNALRVCELLCCYNNDGSKTYKTIPVTTTNYTMDGYRIINKLEDVDKNKE